MEAAKKRSFSNAMPIEVQTGEINDQLEKHPNENSQPSTSNGALDEAHTLNDSQSESNDKGAITIDANTRRSDSLELGRLSSLSSSWKHALLRSRFVKRLAIALTGNEPDSLHSDDQHDNLPRPWTTTFIRFGPLSGLFCLLLALASIVASLGILAGSDRQKVASWSITPSTYLAVFTALANLSVRYAAYQGVIIAWWYRASKGSKLSKLHRDWRSGMSLRGALSSGRHIGMLGLACVFSTVVVIDGPLLQRSSTVVAVEETRPTHLDVTMVPELPSDFSGAWFDTPDVDPSNDGIFNSTWPTPKGRVSYNIVAFAGWDMNFAHRMWTEQLPLEGVVRGCPTSQCKAKIKAPALFPTACTSQIITSEFYTPFSAGVFNLSVAPPLENDYFIIDVNLLPVEQEKINLITAYWTGDSNCEGSLNLTICTLESGIGEYDFVLDHDKATIDPDSALRPGFVALANNTAVNNTHISTRHRPSTLAGVVQTMGVSYGTLGFYNYTDGALSDFTSGYETPLQWTDFKSAENHQCPSYLDPTNTLLQAANMLMIYAGFVAGTNLSSHELLARIDPGLEINSTVVGTIYENHNVFHTNYWFYLGAAIVEIVCVVLIAPTYWGWWRFGRPISFSPVEIAKAFGSPMLAGYDSNASGNDLAQAVGDRRVRYGATKNEVRKLMFADPALVDEPEPGARYDPHS